MLVRELIDRLEASGLLDHEIIEALRQQLEESGARVSPEAVAKLLVDNGHLTRFQATKVIGDLRGGDSESSNGDDRARDGDGDLGLADEEPQLVDAEGVATAIILDDDDDIPEAVLEDDDDILVAEEVAADAEPVMTAEAVDDLASLAPHPVVRTADTGPQKNVWDSFWIYGIAGVCVALLIIGYLLVFVLNRESAGDFIARADQLFGNSNFAGARDVYEDFIEAYPGDQNVSKARVRKGIAEIALAKDTVGDAGLGLEKASQVLPTIEREKAFEDDKTQLGGLLVDIGDKISEKADSSKLTDDKEKTLNQLNDWFTLIENPVYMTSTLRQNLGPRITAIEETQARVQRDIRRDRDLAKTLADIRTALDAKETKQAYDFRMTLVRNYPRLIDHPELSKLVLEASDIQQQLVQPVDSLPEVTTDQIDQFQYKSVFLDNLSGRAISELVGRVVYFRARGSVLAVAADTGTVLWRRYIGQENPNPPVSLGDSLTAGVLLSDGQRQELQRVAENVIQWRAKIGEPFSQPQVDDRTVYLSTISGRVLAIDTTTGDPKWGRQLPQTLPVPPGFQPRGSFLYQPGEHSNLYVLSSQNGACVQSYYLGHDIGTIAVAPVQLLGHLFVLENAGSDFSLVHILAVNPDDGTVQKSQASIRLNGVVTAPPEVQERKIIVLTEFGQVAVLDVEPSAEGDKVRIAAQQVATYSSPTRTQMAVGRNEMWVTGTRIGRFQLQINTGKVIGDWVQNEGDRFVAKPLLLDGFLLHARELRDAPGVRITAADKNSGLPIWQNDVAVPISMVSADAKTQSIYATTAQAALYRLGAADLVDGKIAEPVERLGGNSVSLNFATPIDAGQGRSVLLNQAAPEQLVVFDPSRERGKLRLVTMALPQGRNSAEAIIISDGLLMPMDNGRLMLMNWESGRSLGSPFQPPSKPGETVKWTTPVPNPADPGQLLIGDSRSKLYRLRIGEQIRELGSADVQIKFAGPAAAGGGAWLAASIGNEGDTLVTYSATTLEQTGQKIMGSPIVFGPVSSGDAIVLQTADGKFQRVNEAAEVVWSIDLPGGLPIATPMMEDGQMFVTGALGWILKLDPTSGEIQGRRDVGQPLAGNPLMTRSQMLVPGNEGALFVVEKP